MVLGTEWWINVWIMASGVCYLWKQFWQCDFANVLNRVAQWAFSHMICSPALIGRAALANRPSFAVHSNTSPLLNLSRTSDASAAWAGEVVGMFIFFCVSIWRISILIIICASFSSLPRFSIGSFERSKWVTVSLWNITQMINQFLCGLKMKLTEMTLTLGPNPSWPNDTEHFSPSTCVSFPRDSSSRPVQCPATHDHIFPYDRALLIDWPIKLRNLVLPNKELKF